MQFLRITHTVVQTSLQPYDSTRYPDMTLAEAVEYERHNGVDAGGYREGGLAAVLDDIANMNDDGIAWVTQVDVMDTGNTVVDSQTGRGVQEVRVLSPEEIMNGETS